MNSMRLGGLGRSLFLLAALLAGSAIACWRQSGGPGGGIRLALAIDGAGAPLAADTLKQTLDVIRRRLDWKDASGNIQEVTHQQSSHDFVVELSSEHDAGRICKVLTTTGLLELRLIAYPEPGGPGVPREAGLARYKGELPADVEMLDSFRESQNRDNAAGTAFFAVEKRCVITNRDIRSARPMTAQFNQPAVDFRLKPEAARIFGEFTAANLGRGLGLVLDGKVLSAPVIRSRIDDHAMIEGRFTKAEAEEMAMFLRYGPLPARVNCRPLSSVAK